jgi:hypothetical protein
MAVPVRVSQDLSVLTKPLAPKSRRAPRTVRKCLLKTIWLRSGKMM